MEEKIVGLIPMLKKPKSFGRWDSYAVIITDQRTIFAQLTSKMLKDAAMEAQRKGKEEGKGFFSRWADQIKTASNYSERYLNIPPEETLHENPGNFAIPNPEIKFIEIKKKRHSGWGDETEQITTEIKFVSAVKKDSFNLDGYSSNMAKMLKDIFGSRVET